MDERTALRTLAAELPAAGDDAAVVDGLVVTTDMLHETTDFPTGTTRYTAGWRAVGASLSDVAAMGAPAVAAVAAYAAPEFDEDELSAFVRGARDVCDLVDAEYVGGDLDDHDEFTTATTAIGRTHDPVFRSGANPGDLLCVTGTFGRSAAALRYFERGDAERGNDLFQFEPRVAAGVELVDDATAMMDSSDGLARSVHQLAEASDCGFAVDSAAVPVDDAVDDVTDGENDYWESALHFGEDFELVFTLSESALERATSASPTPVTRIGRVTEGSAGITLDDGPLPDKGYTHSS
ncbi:thiamine-monophosphate kinase [Haloprofundus marisrubri]|uniref:Thiamine-monophosphate kinase n=1 Tax=Haloprofundus marisrubri TaxID=1514971 RepID=A0A0W1R6I5_9EURY|nr:thiamine-phosphate kinase [Haloprofundus marisrubri]KTG08911.1 thiamine-monophosphate kinase [Haloprofundus marisrubri]